MDAKEMRSMIWSFTDNELYKMLPLLEEDSNKAKMIKKELQLRKKERKKGTYVDKTMNPKVPLRDRYTS